MNNSSNFTLKTPHQELYDLIISNTSDIVELDSAEVNILMANKIEKIRKKHPYAITPPANEKGRWQTWYTDGNGIRKNLKAKTENELLEKLAIVYMTNRHLDNLTFHALYEEWLIYKTEITESPNTIKRHKQHYAKYFLSSSLHSVNIASIDELMLETECNRIVGEFNLTRKEWGNAKTILKGMFEYAERKKYLQTNPFLKVKIKKKFKQIVRKTGKAETYNTDELSDLNNFLDRLYEESEDSSYLAVKLNFLLGLRVGELCALKWSDLEENHLHVVREEIRNQITNTIEVVEHTKTNQDRFVPLVPQARDILNKIERQGDFIFMRKGTRMTSIRIATILKKFAKYTDMPLKSSHKIRKTYASILYAHGVPLDCIREMLGHSDIKTTLDYIFNPLCEEETCKRIADALSDI